MPITKETIKALCKSEGITLKELSAQAGMNYTGLLNKFSRDSLTVRDLEKLLSSLHCQLRIVPLSTNTPIDFNTLLDTLGYRLSIVPKDTGEKQ